MTSHNAATNERGRCANCASKASICRRSDNGHSASGSGSVICHDLASVSTPQQISAYELEAPPDTDTEVRQWMKSKGWKVTGAEYDPGRQVYTWRAKPVRSDPRASLSPQCGRCRSPAARCSIRSSPERLNGQPGGDDRRLDGTGPCVAWGKSCTLGQGYPQRRQS